MHKVNPRFLLIAGLVLLLAAGASWWWQGRTPTPRLMTDGSVTASQPDGDSLKLTVKYSADGAQRTATGTVNKAAFEWQGRTIWVCYEIDDPSAATLRLPYDPWC
ncbi:hypothetical protein IEE94_15150 [Yimella sp. cx-573]|nr:hypothetical protein [Yimella sp. cx-573]